MNYCSIILLLFIWLPSFGQKAETEESPDTVYTSRYPRGIITKNLEIGRRHISLSPIENEKLRIRQAISQVKYIGFGKKDGWINEKYDPKNELLLPIDPRNGKIQFSEDFSLSEQDSFSLLNRIRSINHSVINFKPIKEAEGDTIKQFFLCSFPAQFSGNKLIVFFDLQLNLYRNTLSMYVSNFDLIDVELAKREKSGEIQNPIEYSKRVHKTLEKMYRAEKDGKDTRDFWRPFKDNLNELTNYLKKVSGGSRIIPKLHHLSDTIPLSFDHTLYLTSGEIRRVAVRDISETFVDYLMVEGDDTLMKRTNLKYLYRIMDAVDNYKNYSRRSRFKSRNYGNNSDFFGIDQSGFFVDFMLGYTSFNWTETTEDGEKSKLLESPPSAGVKLGRKWYFSNQTKRYTPGVQLIIRRAYTFGPEVSSCQSIGIGYTGLHKVNESNGFEFNLNAMAMAIGWDFSTDEFVPIFLNDKSTFGVAFNPELRYRYKTYSIGLTHSQFFELGNRLYDVDYSAVSLTFGLKF